MVGGALLIASGGAQGADKIKVGVGGYFNAFIVHVSQDDGAGQPGVNRRDHRIAREGEIIFTGKTTLDNGITFGINVQLEAETCADQIDETYVYADGSFGRFIIGSEDPASDLMFYGAPAAIDGIGLASPDDVFSTLGNSVATPTVISNISGDSEKITYFTPRMSGFQLGLSYTPENYQEAIAPCTGTYAGGQSTNNAGQQSEVIEVGANYLRRIGGVEMALYAGLARGDLEVAAAVAEDQDQWGLGVEFVYRGFTLGADYREDDQATSGANTDRTDYSIGITYGAGTWRFGAAYAHGETGEGAGLGEDKTDGYQFGLAYDLGPGIVLTGGITHWNVDDNLNAIGVENSATEFIMGTLLTF
jgi:hypothetical protein